MIDRTNELLGTCLGCGTRYSGQILKKQRYQICVKCGSILEVKKNGFMINKPNICFETLYYKFIFEQRDGCHILWN